LAQGPGGIGKDVALTEEAADQQETAAGSGQADIEALLTAANSASARLATVHLAFMATCA
jgi:hypothetical protein